MNLTLAQLQQQIGGQLKGSAETLISGVNSLVLAQAGDLSFAQSDKYLQEAQTSNASAILVPNGFPEIAGIATLQVEKPREAFIGIMMTFAKKTTIPPGISSNAEIADNNVDLGRDVTIAAYVVVRENVSIDDHSVIESGCFIGDNVQIGSDCKIAPNVTIHANVIIGDRVLIHSGTVIGGEGFGYFWNGECQQKIPQLGSVQIEDDVEIGSNNCIDRATFGMTFIRKGVKIDNLVQIAHNNDIGDHSIVISQAGLAGSVTLGKRVTLSGQVAVSDHIKIGDGAIVAGKTGVTKDIPAGQIDWGLPNRPMKQVMKEAAHLARLPKLNEQVRSMSKQIKSLEANLAALNLNP